MDEEDAKDRMFVTALARGLDVLSAFGPHDSLLGNQDIALRTGLAKPTVCRMTHTLTELGYLRFDRFLQKYRLGSAALSLGYASLANVGIRQIARPFMQALADETNVAVSLGSRVRDSMLYVANCRGGGPLVLNLDIGTLIPIATTAMGRAYIAALGEEERDRLMDELKKSHETDWSTIRRGIEKALQTYESVGFTTSVGEWRSEVNAVGRAVISPESGEIFVLNCGSAAFLLPEDKLMAGCGPRLIAMTREIEAELSRVHAMPVRSVSQ